MNEVEFLRRRLAEEQANVESANEAKQEAEMRCMVAERERDIYKVLARTLRSRLNSSLPEGSEIVDETVAAERILGRRESSLTFDYGRMFELVARERNDEEMEEDENEDEDEDFLEQDDDDDDMSDAMNDVDSDGEEASEGDDESLSVAIDDESLILDGNVTMSSGIRSQSRAVSISEADL